MKRPIEKRKPKNSRSRRPNPLMRRIPRELKKDLGKYIALFVFMSLMIGLVSGFLVADGSMIKAYNDSFEKYAIENGHFNCDQKLTGRAIRNIEDEGVSIYELFYKDKQTVIGGEDRTIRLFKPREKVNRADVMAGRLPEKSGEIALDRLFGENNGLPGPLRLFGSESHQGHLLHHDAVLFRVAHLLCGPLGDPGPHCDGPDLLFPRHPSADAQDPPDPHDRRPQGCRIRRARRPQGRRIKRAAETRSDLQIYFPGLQSFEYPL